MCKSFCFSLPNAQSFESHDQKIFQSLAEVVYPQLSKLRKADMIEEEEEVIFTTDAGLQKVQARLQEIATVETV